MRTHQQTTTRRGRRPVALTAVLGALVATLPASSASAYSTSMELLSGTEKVGATATYGFQCSLDGGDGSGAGWVLERPYFPYEAAKGEVTDFSVNTATERAGTYSVDYSSVPEGQYRLFTMCYADAGRNGTYNAVRSVYVQSNTVTTTTDLTVTPLRPFAGEKATITARVSGGVSAGTVTFGLHGETIGEAPVVDGVATIGHPLTEDGAVTATYSGAAEFTGSYDKEYVDVITEVTPGRASLPTTPVVGSTVTVDPGTWSPSVDEGTELTYTWKVDGAEVGTGLSYTPAPADADKQLTVDVAGQHPKLPGQPPVTASAQATVQRATMQEGTITLRGLDGEAAVLDQPIVVDAYGWPKDVTLAYEWSVGDVVVGSATAASYTPTAGDLGKPIAVKVTATAPGTTPVVQFAHADGAVTTPSVKLGSAKVDAGQDVVLPVTVAGPDGGPVPSGTVELALVGTDDVVREIVPVTLDEFGAATVTVSGLPVGQYSAKARFVPSAAGAYTDATTSAEVTVVRVQPGLVTAPSLDLPVGVPAVLEAQVTGTPKPATYVLRDGETVLAKGEVPADGALTLELPVWEPSTHDLVLELPQSDVTEAASAEITVTVKGEPVQEGAEPSADLTTPKGATQQGESMNLVATGFEAGEWVAFYLHSDPLYLGIAQADEGGVATLTTVIPAEAPDGLHTVVATGGESGRWATLALVLGTPAVAPAAPVLPVVNPVTQPVAAPAAAPAADGTWTAPAAPVSGGTLAATGSQAGAVVALSTLLLAAGGLLVLVTRRARGARA